MLHNKQQYEVQKSNKSTTSFDFWCKTLYDNCMENLISFRDSGWVDDQLSKYYSVRRVSYKIYNWGKKLLF